ncbi:MAG: potassium-transporting ATPase subunit KdpA [Bulleidia sp.]
MATVIQYGFYLVLLVVLAVPLGTYISKVMNGETVFLTRLLEPCEKLIYRLLHINPDENMSWKKYLGSVLAFSAIGCVVLFVLQMAQKYLPFNPQHIEGMSWDLSLNTAVSFMTNTNWQAYSGETQLSYLSQCLGLTVQNFVTPATGIAVLYALIRGFIGVKGKGLGSFWKDLTRATLYVLIPLSFVVSIVIASQGVPQTFRAAESVELMEPVAFDSEGNVIENAQIDVDQNIVIVDGKQVQDAQIVTEEFVPLGPAASQIAIKHLGTNGGGFYGVNSAHPLENPNWTTNLFEMLSLLLIPAALCFSFGRDVKDKKQGIAIFMAMFLMLVTAMSVAAVSEQSAPTVLTQNQYVNTSTIEQAGGNMEGKEVRFGIGSSVTWAAWTTAASNGSVNSMHDSYTPIGGLVTILLMELGEVVFGGVGCGLYGMLGFAILTVFIAGLMVGRTPEYLGKKIEPYEMKWAVLVCLATPVAILVFSGIAAAVPSVADSLNNPGAHGFTEMLYAYSSAGGNNGSAFAGFGADTPFLNLTLAATMLIARFLPIAGVLAIAGHMVGKKKLAVTAGTLSTSNVMFVFLLIVVVLLIGALSFFPVLALGPIAEFLG